MVAPMPRTERVDPSDPVVAAGYAALNSFFDRIVVLTLARATARHAELAEALQGLRYEVVHGVDCEQLDLVELAQRGIYDPRRAQKLHRMGRPLTKGQVACALSHVAIWREIAAGPHQRVLVFEDDALPVRSVAQAGAILAELPMTWELVYLGYDRNEEVTLRRRLDQLFYVLAGALGLHRLSAREAMNLLPRPHSARLRRAGFHDQTHAYALTPSAAARLVKAQEPVVLASDCALTRLVLRGEVEAYVTEPKLFYQRGLDSFVLPDQVRAA